MLQKNSRNLKIRGKLTVDNKKILASSVKIQFTNHLTLYLDICCLKNLKKKLFLASKCVNA